MPSLDTLVEDIQRLFTEGHVSSPENVAKLGQVIAETVARRLSEVTMERQFTLRMSNLGRDPEDLWYEAHGFPRDGELDASARIKFLFGDILEHMLVFLAKEAGHVVTDEQKEIEVDGIKGHLDCKIDGVVVDCKSASSQSYKKFKDGSLRQDDAFGYLWQVGGYSVAEGGGEGAFLAIDKQLGHICLFRMPVEEIALYDVHGRIAMLRDFVARPDQPVHDCECTIPDGKSGNMKLGVPCSYSAYKFHKHPGLRVFLYSTGPRFLTKVDRLPDVPEITGEPEDGRSD